MTVTFDKAAIRTDDGALWLALRVAPESMPEARRFVLGAKERPYTADIKEHRKKRSLDANRAYYGSSTYNTKQMSVLLDRIIQDCEAVGIETLSDRERSLLLEEWEDNAKYLTGR